MKKLMGVVFVILVIISAAAIFAAIRTPDDNPVDTGAFPVLKGTNLLLESVTVPDDLSGDFKLLVVAYDSDQQPIVDKWLLPLEQLNEQYPQLSGYYMPLLPQSAADAALPILGGMTLAARSDHDRARTIVVFTDVDAFNELVDVSDKSIVQLFLLNQTNQIMWQSSGSYQYETLMALEAALN